MFRDMKKQIVPLLKQYDVVKASIFGSYARGNYKKSSDVDILIRFEKGKEKSLLKLVEMQFKLGRILKRKVDLVTYNALSPYIKNEVVKNMRVIYAKG